jgi:hypothetical protein
MSGFPLQQFTDSSRTRTLSKPEADRMEWEIRQRGPIPTDDEWKREASRILNALTAEVTRNRKELCRILIARGLSEEEASYRAVQEKLRNGTFSFYFFLKVLVALKLDPGDIRVKLTLPSPREVKHIREQDRAQKSYGKGKASPRDA